MGAIAALPAVPELSQHWTGPVVQELAGSLGVGVAAARIAREARIASLENIFVRD